MKLYPFQSQHTIPCPLVLRPDPWLGGVPVRAWPVVGFDIYGLKPNIGPISQLLATVVVDFHLIAPLRKHLPLF